MTRQLSNEFKRECAGLVLNYGYAHKDAAKIMNVSISSIQRWVTQYRDYVTREQAIADIIDYIEPIYNQKEGTINSVLFHQQNLNIIY